MASISELLGSRLGDNPLFTSPDASQIVEVAMRLGMKLSPDEAERYRNIICTQLEALDAFVQSRDVAESSPPAVAPNRTQGYRPSDSEDPHGAWLWKCRIESDSSGLLTGKTVSFKDNIAVAGLPLTFGSYVMDDFTADFDATIVVRSLKAGGTVIGKNTCNGFVGGFGFGGDVGDYVRPMNPHNHDHVPGGSSSGSAVAVAASEVDVSFGGDQGGSIRIPAAWSGVLGLKPTFGLVSYFGASHTNDMSVDFTGPMARTTEDLAAALEAVAGFDPLDPRQSRYVPESIEVMSTLSVGIDGLRIGILEEGFREADVGVQECVFEAIAQLEQAGATATRVSVPEHDSISPAASALEPEGALALFRTSIYGSSSRARYPSSLIAAVNKMWRYQADLLSPRVKARYILAEISRMNYHGRVYAKAQNLRPAYIRAYDHALRDVDILVMPTCDTTAPPVARLHDPLDRIEWSISESTAAARNTKPFNYTGHPALAVPCGKSGGLPVSMQLVGRFFDDPLLLRVAYAYQHSTHWDELIRICRGT